MKDSALKYRFIFVTALVALSIFLMYPKPDSWSSEDANKFARKLASMSVRPGIDLQGGSRIELQVPREDQSTWSGQRDMQRLQRVLMRRIDNLGVLEANVETTGKFRFTIELPGVVPELVDRVKTLVAQAGKLEFKLEANMEERPDVKQAYESILEQVSDLRENMFPVDGVKITDAVEQGEAIARYATQHLLPPNLRPSWTLYYATDESYELDDRTRFRMVENEVIITGEDIENTSRSLQTQGPVPGFTLSAGARERFHRVTAERHKDARYPRNLAIILDDHLVTAPGINEPIPSGQAIINGTFSEQEVDDMINVFNSGSLKVVPEILREETTGPSIGVAAQRAGILAALIGFVLIFIFMFIYYRWAGAIANLALLANGVLIGGVLTLFGATLTLPGVAGLILTIGMAVDANILIYERVREELGKGKTIAQAIINGYERAFVTILDANITTLITAAVLFWLGTGSVQGFALTLIVGILTSMFSALYVTRLFFNLLLGTGILKEFRIRKFLAAPRFHFTRHMRVAAVLSLTLVVAGLVIFGARFGDVQGIDLQGGTAFRIDSPDQPLSADQLAERLQHVNALINAAIQDGTWRQFVAGAAEEDVTAPPQDEEEASAQARKLPQLNPLEGVLPQGLYLGTDDPREAPPPGSFYEYMVRSSTLSDASYQLIEHFLENPQGDDLALQVIEKTEISSQVAKETAMNAMVAILFAIGAILVYITLRFEFQFGLGAVLALVHDVSITLGLLAVFHAFPYVDVEINLPIIAALLTIIGYSLNDTIVVYDRIRENLRGAHRISAELVNESLNQTLSRTILTSVTTFLVVAVLFVLNYGQGSVLEGFSFALMVGIAVGTYSSVFVASPFLLFWQKRMGPGSGS